MEAGRHRRARGCRAPRRRSRSRRRGEVRRVDAVFCMAAMTLHWLYSPPRRSARSAPSNHRVSRGRNHAPVGNAELAIHLFVMSYSSRFPSISCATRSSTSGFETAGPLSSLPRMSNVSPAGCEKARLLRNHDLAAFADPRRAKHAGPSPASILPQACASPQSYFSHNAAGVNYNFVFPIARGLTEKSCESTGKIYDSLSIPCNFARKVYNVCRYIHWKAG